MRWTIPNLLTVLRLAAAPGLVAVFILLPRPFADWAAIVLFIGAATTDWVDGFLARRWGQETRMGAMLDPIADKAMVTSALLVIVAYSSLVAWLVVPAVLILFREVFVSGLREFLGQAAGTLKVTYLAKWKTTVQMVAISVIFCHGLFEHYLAASVVGMDAQVYHQIRAGLFADEVGLWWKEPATIWSGYAGLALLWLAAGLTVITGWDYLRKAMPHLREES